VDEPIGEPIRLRRSRQRADDLDPFPSEDSVEVTGEFAVAIAETEANRHRSLGHFGQQKVGLEHGRRSLDGAEQQEEDCLPSVNASRRRR
jgi:hypothetical protein